MISRRAYADMYGPTTGDRVRLADTDLFAEVEKDFTIDGEEVKFGGGKVIRDGMGQSQRSQAQGAVDTVITNALIIDHWGIVKADVAILDGRIHSIGKAGNPDVQPGVTIIVGPGTEVIAGEGKILTAGGIDAHIHPGRRRHRPRDRHIRHHLHPRPLAPGPHAAGRRGPARQPRLQRQGQRVPTAGPGRDAARRGILPEAP
jgi:hypothetical protein